jgi:hypothetical protein
MTDVRTGKMNAVPPHALTPEGNKFARMMLGPSGGTAIMLEGRDPT